MGKPTSGVKHPELQQKAESIIVDSVKANLTKETGKIADKRIKEIKNKVFEEAIAVFPADQQKAMKSTVMERINQEIQKQTAQIQRPTPQKGR